MYKLLLVFFFGIFSSAVYSQSVYTGIVAGVNFSDISGADAKNSKMKAGLRIGLFLEPAIAKGFSFESQLLYSQKGYKGKNDNVVQQFNVDYIQLSLLPKYYFVKSLSVSLGPYFAFKVSDKTKLNPNIQSIAPIVLPEVNSFDIGIESKIQFYFTEKFFGDAFFSTGLNKLYKDNTVQSNKIYNSAFGATLGYEF